MNIAARGHFLTRRPRQRATADQVNVKMEDGLSRAGADVENGAISLFDVALASDVGGGKVAVPDDFRVGGLCLLQPGKMLFRNDENVRRGLGIHIFEGEDIFVFVNLLSGNFAAKDAAEQAV